MTDNVNEGTPVKIVAITAGVSDPSTTRMLSDRIAQKVTDLLRAQGREAIVTTVDLAPMAGEIAQTLVTTYPGERVQAAIDVIAEADALIVSTPVYKAGVSGLFKSFIDILDNDLIIATPTILAATAGTSRHAMVVDEQMRGLFAYLRALPVPTSLFAAPEDWGASALTDRIARAATELVALVQADVRTAMTASSWDQYQHQFAGNAKRAARSVGDIDFSSELMRMAAGGASRPKRDASGA